MKSLNRVLTVVCACVVLAFSAAAQTNWTSFFSNVSNSRPKVFPRRPSIIFIQVDGLGYGDLSCNGQTKFQTPNLDKLAAGGVRFTNYLVPEDEWSSHFELVMGKTSMPGAAAGVNVAQVLQNTGYHTGLIGLWDLGEENSSDVPWRKGFDEFAGYFNSDAAQNFYADYVYRYAPYSIHNPTNNQMQAFVGREMIYPNTRGKNEFIPDMLSKAARNFVKANLPDQFNHYRPFFLLLNFKIPASNITVPSDAPFSEEPWPQAEKNRAALIARIDNYVGDLQNQLEKLRLTNNIAIFFAGATTPKKTADIDPAFFHSNPPSDALRAPLIVSLTRWPMKNSVPGKVSGLKCSPVDFLPTAADIALLDKPKSIDGVSLLPAITKK